MRIFALKCHENFANNMAKQNESSGENEEVPGLIIRRGKLY